MKTEVQRRLPGGLVEVLWIGETPVAPRPDEFLSLNPDDASWLVKSVEWDYSGSAVKLTIYVR